MNPTLKDYQLLIGKWKTSGSHPLLPGVALHGHTTFEWAEDGAFLIIRMEIDEPAIPNGVAAVSGDDATEKIAMLYFDDRGVSRIYETSMSENIWKFWRNSPDFSQCFTGIISDDGKTITGKGEMLRNGADWEPDLQLTYTRVLE